MVNRFILLLMILLLLAACATTTPVHTPGLVEREMDAVLADAQRYSAALEVVPDVVSDALIPVFGSELDEYNPALEKFDISVRDLNVQEFYQALVKDTPYNVAVHPALAGTVSLELKAVTLEQVMELVREIHGFEYKRVGSLYQVFPGGLRTEIFQVNYLNITRRGGSEIQVSAGQVTSAGSGGSGGNNSDNRERNSDSGGGSGLVGSHITTESYSNFWGQLGQTLQLIIGSGEGRSVVAAPEAGVVVVRALPSELRTVSDYLQKTELSMQRQVVLEAKILEVILDDGFSQGISWNALKESDELAIDGRPRKFAFGEQRGASPSNPGLEGMFAAALRLDNFEALIQLLSTQGQVHVLSSPRIATVNNQKAVIKVGSDEFFVTEISVDENNDSDSDNKTNTDVQLTPFFSGIALDVTPQISENGRIVLHVHPSISEVADQTKIISLGDRDLTLPLAFSTIRETDSVISALSGQVVVIGGLISDVDQHDTAGVPGLSKLPFFGSAFSQRERVSRKSELVILIKPVIATPESMQQDLLRSQQRFSSLEQGHW
jgi:MSHA biogenesis protein MshL